MNRDLCGVKKLRLAFGSDAQDRLNIDGELELHHAAVPRPKLTSCFEKLPIVWRTTFFVM